MASMEGFNNESIEKHKYHYTFTDGAILGCPMIFECDANDDIIAEEKFAAFVRESGLDVTDSEIRRGIVKN